MNDQSTRIAIATVVLSAAGLIGIAISEGYDPVARSPVPGDVATGGFGSTQAENRPMRHGEKVDPVRGLILLKRDASVAEQAVRICAPVPMHQHEFDAAVQLTYNIGGRAFCHSTVAKRFKAGDYAGACNAILLWDKFQGKTLPGLTQRRQRERALCLGQTQ